ncbi:MAG: hypothetical protein NVSMB55_25220 [Mycobacteriales bacterium]
MAGHLGIGEGRGLALVQRQASHQRPLPGDRTGRVQHHQVDVIAAGQPTQSVQQAESVTAAARLEAHRDVQITRDRPGPHGAAEDRPDAHGVPVAERVELAL